MISNFQLGQIGLSAAVHSNPHRYWRMNITDNNNGGAPWEGMAELDLRYGGVSMVVTGIASASANIGSPYAADKAVDGDNASMWNSAFTTGVSWWRLDMSVSLTIYAFSIRARASFLGDTPTGWRLQSSSDGSTWDTIESFSTAATWTGSEKRTFTLATPTACTKMRFLIDTVQGGGGASNVAIAEVELIDIAGVNYIGVATASQTATGLSPIAAFDGSSSTRWASSSAMPQWIKYAFPSAQAIDEVKIISSSATAETVKAFDLQYSHDDITWVTVLNVTGQTGWTNGEARSFAVP